ncbi:hypothetical protein RJT34_25795 [Clitoria ternatea]|uniref:Uncharacterized protein n=1 Tax=Clitoria ternatea TaxID=43366 RepID=A0AAN9FYD0_CLITE
MTESQERAQAGIQLLKLEVKVTMEVIMGHAFNELECQIADQQTKGKPCNLFRHGPSPSPSSQDQTLHSLKPSLFFSTSGDSNPKSPFDSFFRDLKDSLNPRSSNSHKSSLHEIQKNLSTATRPHSLPPLPPPTPPQEQISFQEIYNRNMPKKPTVDFGPIRESLKNICKGADGTAFRNALNLKSSDSREIGRGTKGRSWTSL